MDGLRYDRVVFDEWPNREDERRELIVSRPDGSTYSAEFPAELDLGQLLGDGETVALEAS